MKLLLQSQRDRLIKNFRKHKDAWNDEHPTSVDSKVVVKLFNPTGAGIWWLTELDPDTNIAFGVAHIHCKEMGYIDMKDIETFKGTSGLPIERDMYFESNKYTLQDIIEMPHV